MRVLITGAAGFVGTSLNEYLRGKYDIITVDLVSPRERFAGSFFLADLTSIQDVSHLLPSVDVIIHFAAQARVDPSYQDPIGTYRANVQATINLLEKAKKDNSRFIYASSEIIYGQADEYPCKEHFHLRPDSPYAASKAAADLMVQQLPNTVVIRSGMGYGPRSPPNQVVTKFILKCLDGKPLIFPERIETARGIYRHPTRDVNYIGNFVRGIEQVLEHPDVSGVFNMGSGQEIDMLELAYKIALIVGDGEVQFDPNFKYRPGEEGKRTWLDNSKARAAFGYAPQVRLEEGLALTVNWLKKGGRRLYGW